MLASQEGPLGFLPRSQGQLPWPSPCLPLWAQVCLGGRARCTEVTCRANIPVPSAHFPRFMLAKLTLSLNLEAGLIYTLQGK